MALDKEARIGELTNSGSKAIKSIDPYGRHNYFAEQMKEVNGSMDGEISGKLRRPKYDEEQLLLAIDTEVDELIPDKPKDLPDVVLQSDYDALRAQLDACLAREADLRRQLASAQSKISELESEIEGLRAELDASKLRVTVAENSAEAASDKFAQTSIDLQQAIQKSVAEAIERVSLEAQVEGLTAQKEALVAQVSALENQVAGVQAQLQAGAESAAGKWTANIVPKAEQNEADLYYYSTRKGTRSTGWKNGPNIDLTNATEEAVTFTFTKEGDGWLQLPPTTTVQSGETKKVSFGPSGNKALNGKRRRKKDYNGNVKVQAAGETITFNYKNKHHRG
jgi:predicted  nucleic acid-binding Zn-ribbon protein